ncbi:MAG: sigma-70 family RNA polymerase sigma factor [Actinomycetota bacterium]|nr:sigma-70 family RNA polymerase sigma factor [Actinomycetota bacterium]
MGDEEWADPDEEGLDDPEFLSGAEGEALATSAGRSQVADRALAEELQRPEPVGAPTTARYLDELVRRPRLQVAAERELLRAAQRGDAQARGRLVEAYMPLIASVARVYRGSVHVDRVELLQEGVVGLLRALERYDADRGTPFWAYAAWWVRQAMQQLVSELTRPAVLSDRALRQLSRLRQSHREALQRTGREPTREQLAQATGLEIEQVDNLLAIDRVPRAVEQPVVGEEGAVGTFGELLVDPLAEGAYERALDAIEAEELVSLLSGLSDREREILRARYGLDGEEQSLRQIADRAGVSAERVRQLEQRALGKLAAAAGVR